MWAVKCPVEKYDSGTVMKWKIDVRTRQHQIPQNLKQILKKKKKKKHYFHFEK